MLSHTLTLWSIWIILSRLRLGLPAKTLSLKFPHQNPVSTPLDSMHAAWPAQLIFLDFITQHTYVNEEANKSQNRDSLQETEENYAMWIFMVQLYPIARINFYLATKIFLGALLSDTFILFSKCERPSFAPIQNIMHNWEFLCILIIIFLDLKPADKQFWTEWQQQAFHGAIFIRSP
jgi:hypothetical protein